MEDQSGYIKHLESENQKLREHIKLLGEELKEAKRQLATMRGA